MSERKREYQVVFIDRHLINPATPIHMFAGKSQFSHCEHFGFAILTHVFFVTNCGPIRLAVWDIDLTRNVTGLQAWLDQREDDTFLVIEPIQEVEKNPRGISVYLYEDNPTEMLRKLTGRQELRLLH